MKNQLVNKYDLWLMKISAKDITDEALCCIMKTDDHTMDYYPSGIEYKLVDCSAELQSALDNTEYCAFRFIEKIEDNYIL